MITAKGIQDFKFFSKLLSDENLTKKASLNALAATLDYGARLLVGFIITPLLVCGLGDFFYGTWRVMDRMVGSISPASGRATQALKWTLASQQDSTHYEGKRRCVGNALVVWTLFLPILSLAGGILTWFVPYWINASVKLFWHVRLAAGLLVINLILTSLVEIPRSVLVGENLGYKRMGVSAILVFVGGGFTWMALHLDSGIAGVAVSAVATTLLTGILFLLIVRINVPWFGVAKPSFEEARKFLGLSWWFLLWNLVMRVMIASDVLLLGMLYSVELVTTYSLTKYAPETLITLVTIMVLGIKPGLGGIIGSGNLPKVNQVRNEIMLFTWLVVTALGLTILIWNSAFIRLWVGAEYSAGYIPTLLIVMVVTQFVLIRNDANIIDLTLRLRSKVIMGALSVTLSLFTAGLLVSYFKLGIVGLCLGLIAGRSVLSIGYPIMVGRFLTGSSSSQLKSILRPAFVTILLFFLATKMSNIMVTSKLFNESGWIEFILYFGLTLCLVLLLTFFLGLSAYQQRLIIRRFRTAAAIMPG